MFDGDGRAEAIYAIDFRALHLIEKLASVGRERLDIPALAFGINGIEGQGAFSGATQAGDDGECISWDLDVDVLQIVLARAMHGDTVKHIEAAHERNLCAPVRKGYFYCLSPACQMLRIGSQDSEMSCGVAKMAARGNLGEFAGRRE